LEKRYNDDIELEDAIHTAILTLKEGFEGQVCPHSLSLLLLLLLLLPFSLVPSLRDFSFASSSFCPL